MEYYSFIRPKGRGIKPKQIKLLQLSKNEIAIVKKRKSRIIVKDGLKIIEQSKAIKTVKPDVQISLIIKDNNICSKTIKLLNENNISIISE